MSVTSVHKDPAALTMSITARFDAPVERVWEVWADPRQLERWWGPPRYPAPVVDHELAPGGLINYYMTGPEGQQHGGWWRVLAVDPPHSLEFEDGFSDEAGEPNPDMPVMVSRVALAASGDGATTMTVETTFPSLEAMEKLTEMGMEEGMTLALGQIVGLLAA
jgi:uncharacterized protein YndB with AHSA1/START domain